MMSDENGESFGRKWLSKAKEKIADDWAQRSIDAVRAQRLANGAMTISAKLTHESRPGALKANTPETWAYWLAEEATERLGLDAKARLATIYEIMHTFAVLAEDADTRLPLRMHSTARWPKSRPLPADWAESLYVTAEELREWATEHFPSLLQSALLGEPAQAGAPATEPTPGTDHADEKAEPDFGAIKSKGGRPKEVEKKARIVRQLIEHMADDMTIGSGALPGSAANLLDACQRIEKAKTRELKVFDTTEGTLKNWVAAAGYGFKIGRTPEDELKYWTRRAVKTMVNIPGDVFT